MSREKSKAVARRSSDELRPVYDFSKAMPNKYARRYAQGTNVVLLEPEVAAVFRDSKSVNAALKPLAKIIRMRGRFAT